MTSLGVLIFSYKNINCFRYIPTMAQSINHQQLTVTILMILCMKCYLLSRSSLDTTNSVRNFGKKPAFSIHKYRQLRYTREVLVGEEVDEHHPPIDDAEFLDENYSDMDSVFGKTQ